MNKELLKKMKEKLMSKVGNKDDMRLKALKKHLKKQ